jgi:hypothetical protein
MAWIRHATASVRFVFVSAADEAKLAQVLELSNRVLAFLRERGQATRSQISAECFRGKVPKARDRRQPGTPAGSHAAHDQRAVGDRVNRVVLKLARCHAAFELNEPQLHDPSHLGIKPLSLMTEDEREAFERDDDALDVWPEVGSRAMQRVLVAGTDAFVEGWVTVQEGNYRFRTSQANGLTVKIVLREYLGCEIVWD